LRRVNHRNVKKVRPTLEKPDRACGNYDADRQMRSKRANFIRAGEDKYSMDYIVEPHQMPDIRLQSQPN